MVSWAFPSKNDTVSNILMQTVNYTLNSDNYCYAQNVQAVNFPISGNSTGNVHVGSGSCATVIYIVNNAKTNDSFSFNVSLNNPNATLVGTGSNGKQLTSLVATFAFIIASTIYSFA